MPTEPVYLTTREVADHFRVNPSTVRRWADAGEIPVAKKLPGGEYRFTQSAVDAFGEVPA